MGVNQVATFQPDFQRGHATTPAGAACKVLLGIAALMAWRWFAKSVMLSLGRRYVWEPLGWPLVGAQSIAFKSPIAKSLDTFESTVLQNRESDDDRNDDDKDHAACAKNNCQLPKESFDRDFVIRRHALDVVTKWLVYSGIGYLTVAAIPQFFAYAGL